MIFSRTLRHTTCALLLSVLSSFAFAGSPGPWSLVFIDISPPLYRDGQKLALELRDQGELPASQGRDCFLCAGYSDAFNSVSMLYIYTVPVGLYPQALRRAVEGDEAVKREMQTVLKNFAYNGDAGVDGLLIYDHQPGKVTVYAMGKVPGKPLQAVSRPVKNYLSLGGLDKLLEEAANTLPREI